MNKLEIKELRKSLKLTQKEMGIEVSKVLGLEKPIFGYNVYRWESGKCVPHATFMGALEKIKQNKIKSEAQ